MNKLVIAVLLVLFPALVLAADGSLSFAPPASDYSVIFLGNLFGVVDGVLHGTGSQIMGNMFGVFNSAVLALGGIIIMYTLLVSTMNTAHEGQMLGQKWSSIWIPVRSTMGLALLIPKASGYCLMQIFVMWIVVQGVGAADKVWEAALGYLNRGGVIIQSQTDPSKALTQAASAGVSGGAMTILSGQVCMLGLQNQLQSIRQSYLNTKQNNTGPCAGTPSTDMANFCNTAVPDFITTVNAVTVQNQNKNATHFSVTMPNFDSSSPYSFLNGICGTITWNPIDPTLLGTSPPAQGNNSSVGGINNITAAQLETAQMSRAIAIQQMYLDLSAVAQVMVNNDPAYSNSSNPNSGNSDYSLVATQQFGVPYTANGTVCTNYDKTCQIWGPLATPSGTNSGVLFNGTEFLGAINDYNGIMMPTLNLIKQTADAANANKSREFIANATTQGWMMAGSYFFDLVTLNGNAVTDSDQFDKNTGLDSSSFDLTELTSSFGQGGSCVGTYAKLCTWFGGNSSYLNAVQSLINGAYLSSKNGVPIANNNPVKAPDLKPNPKRELVSGQESSTVYGFINNSVMVQLPGQPGLQPLQFANMINFSVDTTMYYLQHQNFDCGRVKILFFSFCLGQMFGDLFYNYIFRYIYNFFLTLFAQIINQVIMAFLMIPLQGMADIFKEGLKTISTPGVNPIVALANMGTMYINFSANLWLMLLDIAVVSALIPLFGVFIFALISLAMPLLMAWIGIMVGIGFTTAYYIPVLPYMIFTFGTLAWLIAVIEAMVAAPIVALGVTHPEGHDAFGKGEHAIMILMNVFLRPSMMIIGYISAISLSYVGVWILNAGFDHAIGFIQGNIQQDTSGTKFGGFKLDDPNWSNSLTEQQGAGNSSGKYTEWAGIYAYFFSILMYTTMYLIIVQKAFTLISLLPDRVLRWIGGSAEDYGKDSASWGDEAKQAVKSAGDETQKAQGQMDKQLGGYGQKAVGGVKSGIGKLMGGKGNVSGEGSQSSTGPNSTPSGGKGPGGAE
ncbi:type IVB secretion system protein DotA [Legionella shakespearei]|uniref:Defect in organelle trafficking protein DotA n=1 Tax=Legionella shakespearei DSM 23087 TaxID=1122169 RepID=A0A0W0YSV7_9GAMM|nr:type IVB secretion system protein DotA [Legionella shakespearei]KTD59985.1 defect in organelle trafficking protein DotA [Legionella shakespearei DSM 23087]